MNEKRQLPKGRLGALPKLDKQIRPTGEIGWLSPQREANAGGGWWIWKCRCGTEVSKLARYVRKHAESGATPKCSVRCTWKPAEAVA
jgi:hypothetical protein